MTFTFNIRYVYGSMTQFDYWVVSFQLLNVTFTIYDNRKSKLPFKQKSLLISILLALIWKQSWLHHNTNQGYMKCYLYVLTLSWYMEENNNYNNKILCIYQCMNTKLNEILGTSWWKYELVVVWVGWVRVDIHPNLTISPRLSNNNSYLVPSW